LAVTNRRSISPEIVAYIAWLVSSDTQTSFIPEHDGQPALASAWRDPELNRKSSGFYADTMTTIQGAQIRPRFAGYTAYQENASARIREGLLDGEAPADIVKDIRVSFSQCLAHAGGRG
jgi:multiple sugar transport system substrate-binding protein